MQDLRKYELITCFNGEQCIYEKCDMFAKASQMCKIELLKKQSPIRESLAPIEEETSTPEFNVGTYIDVEGEVLNPPFFKEGNRKDGTLWRNAGFEMDVNGTKVRVTLWDGFVDEVQDLRVGDTIKLANVNVKPPYKDVPQLNSAKYTKVN